MNAVIALIALISLALCLSTTLLCAACALAFLRTQGLRWSWQQATCGSPMRYKHIQFLVSNDDVLKALHVLERRGFTLASAARAGWNGGTMVTMRKTVR